MIGFRGMLAGFHDADVLALRGQLPISDDVRYVHIGSDPRAPHSFADLADVPAELVEERPAVAFEQYGPQLAGIDVAVIPLSPRPFTAAKSAIAALEWHAAGVPWLATDHPEFARVGNGAGMIYTAKAWPAMLDVLADAHSRRVLWEAQTPLSEPFGEKWARVVLSTMTIDA